MAFHSKTVSGQAWRLCHSALLLFEGICVSDPTPTTWAPRVRDGADAQTPVGTRAQQRPDCATHTPPLGTTAAQKAEPGQGHS